MDSHELSTGRKTFQRINSTNYFDETYDSTAVKGSKNVLLDSMIQNQSLYKDSIFERETDHSLKLATFNPSLERKDKSPVVNRTSTLKTAGKTTTPLKKSRSPQRTHEYTLNSRSSFMDKR